MLAVGWLFKYKYMSRSRKKPIIKDNGYLKDIWHKISRKKPNQLLRKFVSLIKDNPYLKTSENNDVNDIICKIDDDVRGRKNDWDYIDYVYRVREYMAEKEKIEFIKKHSRK